MTVSAYTATLPGRINILEKAIKSVIDQVDRVQVVLNNVSKVPSFLENNKITVLHSDNRYADGSRFIGIEKVDGYVMVFDDDIIYPADYVATLKSYIDRGHRMVCPMGKILKPRPINSYYKDSQYIKAFRKTEDTFVDIPGACGVMWHTDNLKISIKNILTPNSDLCLAKVCKDNGFRPLVVAHEADWLTNLWTGEVTKEPSIYGKYRHNDKQLTEFVNKWI